MSYNFDVCCDLVLLPLAFRTNKSSSMLLSMTGYGRASGQYGEQTINVEIKSLNSKYTDLRLRSPQALREREIELRRLVTDFAQRGKLEMTIELRSENGEEDVQVNTSLLNRLFNNISNASEGQLSDNDAGTIYAALLRIPNVIKSSDEDISDELWENMKATVNNCLNKLQAYRKQEGEVLSKDLSSHAESIKKLLADIEPFEADRITLVRERMEKHLQDYLGRHNVDNNRYEQEVIFYLEKIDINEEQVRLKQNCDYFLEILGNSTTTKGRKLTFISQEIGREINTLGAKAYSADIQKLVVVMKEHLEKIKEQLANVV